MSSSNETQAQTQGEVPTQNRLHPLAQAEVDSLQAKGIAPTLDDVVWLNDLAREIESPRHGVGLSAGCPVRAGDVWLWPMTVAGGVWYEYMAPQFDGQGDVESVLVAFTLARGRDAGAFDALWTYDDARRAVLDWRKRANCTPDELILAVNYALAQDGDDVVELDPDHPKAKTSAGTADTDQSDQPPDAPDWSDTIAWLCSAVSGPPEMWERQVSRRFLLKQIHALNQQNAAQGKAPDPADPRTQAEVHLLRAAMNIEHRHRKAAEAGADNG